MNIRPATLEDADGIAAVLRELEEYPSYRDEALEALTARVRANLETNLSSNAFVLVASGDERVMGYASAHWLTYLYAKLGGYVSELLVQSGASRKGAGTALVEAVVEEARARGCRRLRLINLRDAESFRRAFYAKRGWIEQNAARFVLNLEVKA